VGTLKGSTEVAKAALLDISSLDAVEEELLSLVGPIPGALVKGVPEEEHGVEDHSTGPDICWPALVRPFLPHVGKHFRSCRPNHF